MKIEKQKRKSFSKLENNRELKLYLIHHMHHFGKRARVRHELHHCFLFSQKKMKGKKYNIVHKLYKDNFFHCLNQKFKGVLYDHVGNSFLIKPKRLDKEIIYEIKI